MAVLHFGLLQHISPRGIFTPPTPPVIAVRGDFTAWRDGTTASLTSVASTVATRACLQWPGSLGRDSVGYDAGFGS